MYHRRICPTIIRVKLFVVMETHVFLFVHVYGSKPSGHDPKFGHQVISPESPLASSSGATSESLEGMDH